MKSFTIATLCVGLVVAPLVAKAADLVLFDGLGRPVAVIMPQAAPLAMPAIPADLFDQQDASLGRMMQAMRTMEAAFSSNPMSLDPAAFGPLQPGVAEITTSFSDGHSFCSRTVTYQQQNGGEPIIQVRQTGDSCTALPAASRRGTVPAVLPEDAAPQQAVPQDNPNSPKLIRVEYRHRVHQAQPSRG